MKLLRPGPGFFPRIRPCPLQASKSAAFLILSARRTMTTATKITLPRTPLFEAISKHPQDKTAIVHSASGKKFSYGSLLGDIAAMRARILVSVDGKDGVKSGDLREKRVALLVENGYEYVVGLLAVIASGGIAVPLCTAHPAKEMRYVLGDSTPSALIATPKFRARAEEILDSDTSRLLQLEELAPEREQEVDVELRANDWKETKRGALIIYTSGTTNLPKGVVSTHTSLSAQASSLITAWEMSPSDHLLHVLPLHHVHGIVNATFAPLMSGGVIEYLFPFSPSTVWSRLIAGVAQPDDPTKRDPITLFMAVPTIYNRLISSLPSQPPEIQNSAATAIQSLRLAISGSAALPSSIRENWRNLAGTFTGGGSMLERYGMTEIGMALSNRLEKRVNNAVGWPLPGVEARLVDIETGDPITQPNVSGEIQIRGPTVFREYWNKPEATAKEFVEGDWFKTGDVATMDADGCYFIHGRRSVDIIKSGGEKISALEVEREILELPQVKEAAVVAIPDPDWGQRVAAVVVLSEQAVKEGWQLEQMRTEMKKRIAGYKVPTIMRIVDEIERNQMGKINKKTLIKSVFADIL